MMLSIIGKRRDKMNFKNKKVSMLQLVLTVVFVTCLVISNIIAGKQILLPYNLIMPAAVVIFPVTYILSDIFSEVYGYKWSRTTNYLGIAMNLIAVLFFTIAINLKAPVFYQNQDAFSVILGNTPRMLIASTLGLWLGDYINDNVFRLLKKNHKGTHEGYSKRAILSSLAGELGDSLIFIPIAFFGDMPLSNMVIMMFTQAILKVTYEIVILPVSSKVMKYIARIEKV